MTHPVRFDIYADERGEWRWVARSRNGRKVASSGEAFHDKAGAVRAARRFIAAVCTDGAPPALVVPRWNVRQIRLDV